MLVNYAMRLFLLFILPSLILLAVQTPLAAAGESCSQWPNGLREKIAEQTVIVVPRYWVPQTLGADRAQAFVGKSCTGLEQRDPVSRLNCEALLNCLSETSAAEAQADQRCPLPFAPMGTGFIDPLPSGELRLSTAWHVLAPAYESLLTFLGPHFLAQPERAKKLHMQLHPSFLILDGQQNVIFDSAEHPQLGLEAASFIEIGDALALQRQQALKAEGQTKTGFNASLPQDYAHVRLRADLIRGGDVFTSVKRAEEKVDLASCVYSAGFRYDEKTQETQLSYFSSARVGLKKLLEKVKPSLPFLIRPMNESADEFMGRELPDMLSFMGFSPEAVARQYDTYSEEELLSSVRTLLGWQQRRMVDYKDDANAEFAAFYTLMSVYDGHSGSPVFNERLEKVGLLSATFYKENPEPHEAARLSVGSAVVGLWGRD